MSERPKLEPEYLSGTTTAHTTKKKSCFWGHDWTQWETSFERGTMFGRWNYSLYVQHRYCTRCNKLQKRDVS